MTGAKLDGLLSGKASDLNMHVYIVTRNFGDLYLKNKNETCFSPDFLTDI